MLWLNARSLIELGMTTATRKGSAGAAGSASGSVDVSGAAWGSSTGAAGASVGLPHALKTSDRASRTVKIHVIFFIFFLLLLKS